MRNLPNTNAELLDFCGTRICFPDGSSTIKAIDSKQLFDKSIIFSENKSNRIKSIIKCAPMDPEWKERCLQTDWWAQDSFKKAKKFNPKASKKMYNIKEKLLSFAGEMACMSAYEDADTDNILNYGQFWIGNNIKIMRGENNRCHRNSCELWLENKNNTRICTGFALTDDGMWREHSWLIHIKARSNQIVETTVPRIVYYGYVMTTEQCEAFCDCCLW